MTDFTIKPRMNSRTIKAHIEDEQELKKSEARRESLENIAIMKSGGEEIHVQISGDEASVDLASAESDFGYTDRLVVNVRAEIPEQVMTQYDDDAWDLMVQKMDLYRELGHILYTDWPEFEEILTGGDPSDPTVGVPDEHQGMFINWFDHLEDAFIEGILSERFDIEDELRVTNANLLKSNRPDQMVSLHAAVIMRIVEEKFPVGWVDKLMDPNDDEFQFLVDDDRAIYEDNILPELNDRIPELLDEPNPVERYKLIEELYNSVGLYFDNSVMPGQDETHSFDMPDEAIDFGSGTGGSEPGQGQMPDIGQQQGPDPGQNPGQQNQEPIELPDVDLERDYSQQANQDKDKMDIDASKQSFEKWGRIIDEEYDQGTTMKLQVLGDNPDGTYEDERFQEAEQQSKVLEQELRERLKKANRTKKQKKKRTGKPDPNRVHKTELGDIGVFTKNADPDEKEYTCIIALDRSGSMGRGSSGIILDAEKAAMSLAIALENVGVDVGIMSVSGSDIMLEKDFEETIDECKHKVIRGYNGGGTPFSDMMALARPRLEQEGDSPFVITILDGKPDHREKYRDELSYCDFPVLGTYIDKHGDFDEDDMNDASYFHKLEMREASNTFQGLRSLVKGVMF